MPKVTPSIAARAKWAASKVCWLTPNQTPVPSGTFGVRSPSKYGSNSRPREPAGTEAALAPNFSYDQPKSSRTISVATVTFIVQSNGSQRLVESQKAAISPCGSTPAFSEQAEIVPLVTNLGGRAPGA